MNDFLLLIVVNKAITEVDKKAKRIDEIRKSKKVKKYVYNEIKEILKKINCKAREIKFITRAEYEKNLTPLSGKIR